MTTTQLGFINDALLSVGERDYMTAALTTAAQRRAYKIFKDSFISFTHECAWSFLSKVGTPSSWSGNVAVVPQYQQMIAAYLGTRRLLPIFNTEVLTLDQTIEGTVRYFCLQDNTHVSFWALPSTADKALIKLEYVEEPTLPAYSGSAVIPFTDDFVNIMAQLMSAKLCLQMLDDEGGYQSFMREYGVRLAKAVQKDQRISRSRPNMYKGGR